MLQRVKEVQESDLRMVGALARNIQRVLAVTQADIDAAAAQGKAWVVKRVVKVNDPLDNMRGGTQLVIKQNSIQPGQNVMRVLYSGNGKTVGPAVAPLSLPGAAAEDIMSLIAFGGTEQGLPDGYTQQQFVYMMAGSYLKVEDLLISAGYRVEFEFQTLALPTPLRNFIGGRANGMAAGGGFRLSKLASGGTTLNRVVLYGFENGTEYYDPTAQFQPNTRYKYTYTNGVCTLESGGSVVSTRTFTVTDTTNTKWGINSYVSGNDYWQTDTGEIYVYSVKVWNDQDELVMNLVPAIQQGTVPVVGFYDTVDGTFRTAAAGTFAAGPEVAPAPNAPMDIVCNNGVLKFTANEANYIADNVTLGYWLRNNNGQPEASPANFYTAMMPVKPNTSYVCFGYTKDTNVISGYNRIAWYDANGVWIRNSTYTANTPGIDTSPANAAFARFHCNPNGTEVTQELVDSYNWVFQVGTAEVPYTPYSPTKVYTDGPIETIAIKDDQDATVSTATCEDLLSIGTYTDEQEVISGVVTRNVGVAVLDGTETGWVKLSGVNYVSLPKTAISNMVSGTDATCLANSFVQVPHGSISLSEECFSVGASYMNFKKSGDPTVAQFKQWLANQYAAGTPVIVIYPLATQTTNTVTPQPMQTAAGDNTAEITQASMAGLELEVEYVEA